MKARLVPIGNSRGIRKPGNFLKETALKDAIQRRIVASGLRVRPRRRAREGWAEAARKVGKRGDDRSLLTDDSGRSRFDCDEWRW